jgi:hypothetical protein
MGQGVERCRFLIDRRDTLLEEVEFGVIPGRPVDRMVEHEDVLAHLRELQIERHLPSDAEAVDDIRGVQIVEKHISAIALPANPLLGAARDVIGLEQAEGAEDFEGARRLGKDEALPGLAVRPRQGYAPVGLGAEKYIAPMEADPRPVQPEDIEGCARRPIRSGREPGTVRLAGNGSKNAATGISDPPALPLREEYDIRRAALGGAVPQLAGRGIDIENRAEGRKDPGRRYRGFHRPGTWRHGA